MRERGGLEREAAGGRREVFRCPRVRVGRLKLDGERLAGGCRSNDVEEDEGEGARTEPGARMGEVKVMEVLTALQGAPLETDDPITSYMLQAWARLCKCLGQDFLPYMGVVMPPLLQFAQLKPDVTITSAESDDDIESDDDSIETITLGDKRIGIRTSVLEEKATACNMLYCYADELKEGFVPWIYQVAPTLVPQLKFYFHEEVRRAAVAAMPELLRSAKLAVEKGQAQGRDQSYVKQLSDYIIPALVEALHKEQETEMCSSMLDSLNECMQVGDMNVIKILNFDVNEARSEANTALRWCLSGAGSSTQEPRFVWLLLKNDAGVFQWNKSGLTPVHTDIANALQSLLLHAQGCVDIPAETKGSPFFAVKDGSVGRVIELLRTGADTKAWNLRKQESHLNSQNSEGRNQWGGNRLRHVTYDNFCRAVVEDHTVLLLSASGSVRKEALCRIRKGSDASRVLYQEMTAKLACKHDKVNIHFCDRRFRSSPTEDTSVLNFVKSVLMKNKIKTNDFYLRMNAKMLDGDTRMNKIILLEEPTIEVCPRLRGGVHPFYECTYERFPIIFMNNIANLHRDVTIPNALMTANGSSDATFLSHLSQSMLHGLLVHVLTDGHLVRGVTWDGKFTANDVLISADGHIMIDPAIVPVAYTDLGGEQDYDQLYLIALTFAYNQNNKSPVHFNHLLNLLHNSTADLRRNRLFVLLLVCHPSLLNYCEKYKLYGLVELLLNKLTAIEDTQLDNWLLLHSYGHDLWHSLVASKTEFETTFLHNAKKDQTGKKVSIYKPGLRQGFRFGRNFEAHPPKGILNSLAGDSLDHSFFFLLTIVLEGLVKTLQPGQSANDLADILSDVKADPSTMRPFWALEQN